MKHTTTISILTLAVIIAACGGGDKKEELAKLRTEQATTQAKITALEAELAKETANTGGQGWEETKYLDWLLIQLDANFLIRPVQASIAQEMISPGGGNNTVMQLNMGEGKSSVSSSKSVSLYFLINYSLGYRSDHFSLFG